MMSGKMLLAGFVAGSVLGMSAAVMAVPGCRTVVMKKAKVHGRRLMRAARNFM